MCGFVGFLDNDSYQKKDIITDMSNQIIHRGPDSAGYFIKNNIALGFRRLSIIDLDGGSQPITNEDDTLVITFNGEIYNYKELRVKLIEKGHTFKTNADTEVILHGFEEYGENVVPMLRGMFAFVIYNKKTNELFGSRDYFGIKPFYYTIMDGAFIFGSEIKSFLKHPKFKKELNKDALKMFLIFQYSVLEETFFKNVFKLKQGHYFKYKNNTLEIKQYFSPEYQSKDMEQSECEKVISETIESSVKYHQISDVEVGGFLSSGVDSSYIVSVAKPDKTYTVGFTKDGFDETTYAKDLSDILEINNTSKLISGDEFFNILPEVQYHSDEPHANLSAVPLYYLAQLAAEDVKVVLSGEGADELFGGYITYTESPVAAAYKKLPLGLRNAAYKVAKKLPKMHGVNFFIRNAKNIEDSYIGQAFIMGNEEANSILTDKYKSNMRYQDITKPYFDKVKDKDTIIKKMYLDMNLWLPNDILLKADKMTMAHSLELRVPYLDKVLFNVARTLNSKQLINGETTKYAFRKCAFMKIPEEWAKRPKIGFLVPFVSWIKEEKYYNIVKELFNEDFVSEFFDRAILLNMLEKHYNNQGNYGRRIYTIYSFLIWYKEYFIRIK